MIYLLLLLIHTAPSLAYHTSITFLTDPISTDLDTLSDQLGWVICCTPSSFLDARALCFTDRHLAYFPVSRSSRQVNRGWPQNFALYASQHHFLPRHKGRLHPY
ncbi:hypothetical protein BGW80DRAFT_1428436 [Lactifluus volemus]|nr:hypothetical protein BGW80DRAFT_1428436 [Lactifluus volemus]